MNFTKMLIHLMFVHRIREKLENNRFNEYTISTVWGLGYKFQRSV